MAVARLVAAPFPLAASRARGPPARLLPSFAPLPLSLSARAAVPVLRVASDGRADPVEADDAPARMAVTERKARKESERRTYLVAAVMSSLGITSMAAAAVYYRFAWQMEGGEIPVTEMLGTFALSVGAAVGMEFWARWAHRALWHASLWHMHESHHRPRDGAFELNDVFAIVNVVPAMALLAFGFFNRGLVPGLCFGAVPGGGGRRSGADGGTERKARKESERRPRKTTVVAPAPPMGWRGSAVAGLRPAVGR